MWGQPPLRQAQGRLSAVRRAKLDAFFDSAGELKAVCRKLHLDGAFEGDDDMPLTRTDRR